ncbi:hypothetical protein CARUB_v10024777mg [Capsella rubella]|uniref:F-box domain-containing protein n=1 Tax=Capsella rubella TaxID=81985 RepID=R0HT50_9BRAS|nr:putative F-box/LRR-repeat protein At5g54820 [Capsella rubella]EOA28545.1 hypothetical protein CARUB_v10024777mg [Capsella rubella]
MAPNGQDIFDCLPDVLLLTIISYLSFKECVRTSGISRRWRYICYQIKDISFKESEYVSSSITDPFSRYSAWISFFSFIDTWISRVPHHQVVESIEFCFPSPLGFPNAIEDLIEFAVSKRVKKLVLDFTNPAWRGYGDVSNLFFFFKLPECVYGLTSLESLTIYGCEFDPSKLTTKGLLRSLSVGWMRLEDLYVFLSNYPSLYSLSIKQCWEVDITLIAGQYLRELVIENSDFFHMHISFNLPMILSFKYTGQIIDLYFEKMPAVIRNVYLDFGGELEYNKPNRTSRIMGAVISGYFNDGLRDAQTLTVCPYLLQAIPECDNPYYYLHPVETQHLVLRTKLHTKEFNGIRMLLRNCPNLESVTLDMLPPNPVPKFLNYGGINPDTFWMEDVTYKCIRRSLKLVVVRNFGGTVNELNILRYLIREGSEPRGVLKRVELYVPDGMEEGEATVLSAKAKMLQSISKHVQVLCA